MRSLRHGAILFAAFLMTTGCQFEYELPADIPKLTLENDREMLQIRQKELDLTYERMLKELDATLLAKGTSADEKNAAVTSLRNEWTAKKQELDAKFKEAHPAE
jgi:outer membrane lipopolysaccharide assembly protein LptE/RlpB